MRLDSESQVHSWLWWRSFPPGPLSDSIWCGCSSNIGKLTVFHFVREHTILLEKEMVTHCSVLAWKIPWTEEPGRLQSMGLQRFGHDWTTSLWSPIEVSSTVSALDIGFGQSTAGPSPSSPQEGGYKPHEYRGCSTAFPQRGCIPGSFPILMWAENTETFTSRSAGSCTCFDHLILGTFSVFFLSLQNLTSGPPGCCFASDNAPGASP